MDTNLFFITRAHLMFCQQSCKKAAIIKVKAGSMCLSLVQLISS